MKSPRLNQNMHYSQPHSELIPEGVSVYDPIVVSRLCGRSHFGVAKARSDHKKYSSVFSVPPR